MGDTGQQQDLQGHGQDFTTSLAKILRIDVGRADAGLAYAIPTDNPFRDCSDVRPPKSGLMDSESLGGLASTP